MPGIIDLPQFSYEDLEEIVAGGQGSFHIGKALVKRTRKY